MPYTSSSPVSSTATLISTYASEKAVPSAKPAKDYSAALASLQTQYGFMGGNVAPTTIATTPKVKKTNSSGWWKLYHSCTSHKTSTSVPSTTSHPTTGEKDFEGAFAQLQTSLGFGASVPLRAPKKESSTRKT